VGTVYATQTDLEAVGINPSAIANIDPADIAEALAAASARVDSYLRSQYVLPLTNFGKDIVEATCKIAAYELMAGRGFNPAAGSDSNLRVRYEDMVGSPGKSGWLEQVAKGLVSPDVTDSSPMPQEGRPGFLPIPVTASSRGWTQRPGSGRRPPPFVGN
jgi:phage gp36-like protein